MNPKPTDDHSLRAPPWDGLRLAIAGAVDADGGPVVLGTLTAAEELAQWKSMVVTAYPDCMSMAWWVGWWAIQRPMQLEAHLAGYTLPGSAVLAAVHEVSEEAGADPTISYGWLGEDPDRAQVRVRYEWPGFEPMTFLRAPISKSPTHLGVVASVDLWQQLEAHEDTSKDGAGIGATSQEQLASFRPGQFHDGEQRRFQDPEMRALEDGFYAALANPAPSMPVVDPDAGDAWVDPKEDERPVDMSHRDVKPPMLVPISEQALQPEQQPRTCPVCLRPNITPVRFGRCQACERLVQAGNVWELPAPPEGPAMKELGADVYWARVKAISEAKRMREERGLPPMEKMLADSASAAAAEKAAGAKESDRGADVAQDDQGRAGRGAEGSGQRTEVGPDAEHGAGGDAPGGRAAPGEGGGLPGDAGGPEPDDGLTDRPEGAPAASSGFPDMVTVRCVLCEDSKGLMPLAVARDEARHGCRTCGGDSTAIEAKSTSDGKVIPGWELTGLKLSEVEQEAVDNPAKAPEAKVHKRPRIEHKPDMAFRLRMGGRCEWDRENDRPATLREPGCTNMARWIVGAKDAFKVCAACVETPYFAKKRTRIPIQVPQGGGR